MLNIKHLSSPLIKSTRRLLPGHFNVNHMPATFAVWRTSFTNTWTVEERKNREDSKKSLPGRKFYTSKITEMATLTDAYWYYAKMLLFPLEFVTDKSKTLLTLLFMVSGHSCGFSVLNSNILGPFRIVPTVSHKQIKMQITTNTVERVRASLLLRGVGVVTNQGQWRIFPKIIFNIGRWENVSFSKSDYLLIVLELWVWV